MTKDSLGDRMKHQYEGRTRFLLPRRTYTAIRCDGKAFHSYTRQCDKPFDRTLSQAMADATMALCAQAQGAAFGYVQSDEISVLLTDFSDIHTEAWFDGNVQKIASVSASIVTAAFNRAVASTFAGQAMFDARVFTISDRVEVENYFIWRQQDATRNSIQSLAQSQFSHKELQGVSNEQAQELLMAKRGINWNDLPVIQKRGSCVVKAERGWLHDLDIPVFTKDREYLAGMIPVIHDGTEACVSISIGGQA